MKLTNKRIVGGVIALLAVVSVVQTSAIVKITQARSSTNQLAVANTVPDKKLNQVSITGSDLVAQVKSAGGGSCNGSVTSNVLPLPTYNLQDGENTANVYKFRVTNNNVATACSISLSQLDFIFLKSTNANYNFGKIYLMNASNNTDYDLQSGWSVYRPGMNRTYITFAPETPIMIAAGQSIDLFLQAEYIRNTNIVAEVGVPIQPEDYFMFGVSNILAHVGQTADQEGTVVPVTITTKFSTKPIKVQ